MMASPLVAEMIAREGFAAVALDQQHGLYDAATAQQGIAALKAVGAGAIARIPVGDFAGASRLLDFGADAVVAPMINTVADARAFAAAMKYPPVGERSWGPLRAMALAGATDALAYMREANTATLALAMIETRTALDNLDAILATPGIDGVFIGPSDLSITLSNGQNIDFNAPEVERVSDLVFAAARKAGKIPGAYCLDAARAKGLAARGARFIAIGSDFAFLRAGTAEQLRGLK
jgi:4-hydroxy-2-oxoheptanedioate aldolase